MKYCDTRMREYINYCKRQYIKDHLFDCYQKICKGENNDTAVNVLIRHHRKVINSMELKGKNKNNYKTIQYLEHYKNTKNKVAALNILTTSIYRL